MPAVSDIEIEPGREGEAALPQVSAARTVGVGLRALLPGVVVISALAGLATVLGGRPPWWAPP